jgi:hypothetical protein
MLELILPNLTTIIKETIKHDSPEADVSNIKMIRHESDFEIYFNAITNSSYLVQTSSKYDMFGFQNYKDDFPGTGLCIYVGARNIIINFGDDIRKDILAGHWDKTGRLSDTDTTQWWTPSFMLFNRIGGIIWDRIDWQLIDRRV